MGYKIKASKYFITVRSLELGMGWARLRIRLFFGVSDSELLNVRRNAKAVLFVQYNKR